MRKKMSKRVFKAVMCSLMLLLLISCAAHVANEGRNLSPAGTPAPVIEAESLSAVISGGKVPVEYLEPDAYSAKRLAEGKAMFEEKCAICHAESGRDMVYFGDPDFNSARVIGSVKKFVGAATDPEIGEKVFEYLRYNNDGPFNGQDEPFLQPGPLDLEPGVINPVLYSDDDFWGALTGHRTPTAEDIDVSTLWDKYDMKRVMLPYTVASWAEFMPHEVPLPRAMKEVDDLFKQQGYNMNSLPLTDQGMGIWFNFLSNSIYTRNQFGSHDFWKFDRSKDAIEAVYSTSLLCKLGVIDFEYGLPQRQNGEWNGEWAWGPYENTILWGPGSNLDNLNSYGINPFETIYSREAYRNKWTQYSTMFVTGNFQPSSFYWYASMPWGCKTYDAGLFGGRNVQVFTGMMGFAEMWKHSQTYNGKYYYGTEGIEDYGAATRKYLLDMYWMYEGLPYYFGDTSVVKDVFLEMIYRQWTASIGVTDEQLRTLISDSYNLPDGDRDAERYNTVVQAFDRLSSSMTDEEKDFVRAYIRRIYPDDPRNYDSPFNPGRWELVDPAPTAPVVIALGSDEAYVGEEYTLRILRAQSEDGDIAVSASGLPEGAVLEARKGNWSTGDVDYAVKWTPTKDQVGKTFTIEIEGKSSMGTAKTSFDVTVKAIPDELAIEPLGPYTVYAGQELSFPITVNRYDIGKMQFSLAEGFGTVMNNYGDTAGIFTVRTTRDDVGTHSVKVTAIDENGDSAQAVVEINVVDNSPPVVKITGGSGPGGNKNIYRARAGETFTIEFDVTDPDGDTYEISKNPEFPGFIYGNTYSYTVEDAMAENFPGPNVLTFYIKDTVSNGNFFMMPEYKGGLTKKVLLVYFEPKDADTNHTPWAVTGHQTVTSKDTVTLDASASDDTDGDKISFEWVQVDGPEVKLSDAASDKPTFTAPKVKEPTLLKFYVTVTDPRGLKDVAVARVLVNPAAKS
jgi:hypothetical protein